MSDNKGKLYLIPSPLGENEPSEVIPGPVLDLLKKTGTLSSLRKQELPAGIYPKPGLKGISIL
jgi:hypothetical protein